MFKNIVKPYLDKLPQEWYMRRISKQTKKWIQIREQLFNIYKTHITVQMDYRELNNNGKICNRYDYAVNHPVSQLMFRFRMKHRRNILSGLKQVCDFASKNDIHCLFMLGALYYCGMKDVGKKYTIKPDKYKGSKLLRQSLEKKGYGTLKDFLKTRQNDTIPTSEIDIYLFMLIKSELLYHKQLKVIMRTELNKTSLYIRDLCNIIANYMN